MLKVLTVLAEHGSRSIVKKTGLALVRLSDIQPRDHEKTAGVELNNSVTFRTRENKDMHLNLEPTE